MIWFEIWNHESANAVGEFDTVTEALAAVHEEITAYGDSYTDDWTLAVTDGESTEPIARGREIALLSRERVSAEPAERNRSAAAPLRS